MRRRFAPADLKVLNQTRKYCLQYLMSRIQTMDEVGQRGEQRNVILIFVLYLQERKRG
jgi:hypothetical protein